MKFVGQLLGAHLERTPSMELADIYKLLHQAALGPAHAVSAGDALDRLLAEVSGLSPTMAKEPLCDVISPDGQLARIHLRPYVGAGHDLEGLARALGETAARYTGSIDRLARFCGCLGDLADAGGLPYPRELVEAYMGERRAEHWPAVRHSDSYRASCLPAYRVVDIRLLRGLEGIPAMEGG